MAMSPTPIRIISAVVIAALLVGACSGGASTDDTSPTSTAVSTTSTTAPATTTTMSSATSSTMPTDPGLDLSGARWVAHGVGGIHLDDGTLIRETRPFPTGLARDRQGGLVFSDSTGLWWFRSGSSEPELIDGGDAHEVIAVVTTPTGPVAMTWGDGPTFRTLPDGRLVEAPDDLPVELSAGPPWLKWTAANGLSAWVTDPRVARNAEGAVSHVVEPAHLVVARGEEILFEVRIASLDRAWATIHDFDGQLLIISRGPYEPAMPEESFLLVDLAAGEAAEILRAGGTRATLTGPDSTWDGQVQAPAIG